jgi:hypothetical protein
MIKLTVLVTTLLALAEPSDAYEVGETIKITEPIVGCYRNEDAVTAMLEEIVHGKSSAEKYALKIQNEALAVFRNTGREVDSFCDVISPIRTLQYRIMEVGQTTPKGGVFGGSQGVLICIKAIFDDNTDRLSSRCMWVHMKKPERGLPK